MQITEYVTGYCPKQGHNKTIPVIYIAGDTFVANYKIPDSFKCSYSNVAPVCTECPIFNSLL